MTKPLAVLLIEDTLMDADLISRQLLRAGYELDMERVENAEQMRTALLRRPWDIVISDYRLPQFNGEQALALLKELGQDIPFIAVSGTMGEEMAVAMMRAGAHDYVMKGNLSRLPPVVARELEQARVRHERRQAEREIQLKDDLLRRTGQMAKVGGWEYDLQTKQTTTTDEVAHIFGLDPSQKINLKDSLEYYVGESQELALQAVREMLTPGFPFDMELELRTPGGEHKWIRLAGQSEAENGRVVRIRGILHDITERKQRELELQRYREDLELINKLNELANAGAGVSQLVETLSGEAQKLVNARDCAIYLLSPDKKYLVMENFTLPNVMQQSIERLIGGPVPKIQIPIREGSYFQKIMQSERGLITSDPETIQSWMLEFAETVHLPAMLRGAVRKLVGPIYKMLNIRSTITVPLISNGVTIGLLDLASAGLFSDDDRQRIFKISGQVTAVILRKRDEEALRNSEAKYQSLAEVSPVGIYQADAQGRLTYVNPRLTEITGLSEQQMLGEGWLDGVAEEDRERVRAVWARGVQNQAAAMGENRYRRPDGSVVWALTQASPVKDSQGAFAGFVGTVTDITEAKHAQQRIETQLRRLSALNQIDTAITTSLDLNLVLNVLVEQATAQLGMDAAAVLLLNHESGMLEFAAGRGFRTRAIEATRLKIGESFAGQAAASRRAILMTDPKELETGFSTAIPQEIEAFAFYYGVPLMVKGEVKGVLEVLHRREFESRPDWMEYMHTLAEQAAIAIDNAQLVAHLGRTNEELSQAYNATIEGWSRALDLRDKETEGHTLRVTEMAMRLAQAAGIPESELVHVRRGALLHDIGKLGVPDAILLKPDVLTDEEMAVMRQHPLFAYEMLAPIAYLRPALDIPQYHHEMWDGKGYPYGLRGEQIPLMARLFAVIDVWDALLSDRPYRPGWPEEKVLAHIRERAGTHFDPHAVELFFKVYLDLK